MGSRKRPRWWIGVGEGRSVSRASTIERPERRIGIREMEDGVMVVVVYSYPRGVLAYWL